MSTIEICRINNSLASKFVDKNGLVDPADIAAAVRADTILVSIMHANNTENVLAIVGL